jgi:hypothetical protein
MSECKYNSHWNSNMFCRPIGFAAQKTCSFHFTSLSQDRQLLVTAACEISSARDIDKLSPCTSEYKTKHCCAYSCKKQCKEEKQSCYYINTSIGRNTIIFSSRNPHYHTITSFCDRNMSTVVFLFVNAKGRHKVTHNIDYLQSFTQDALRIGTEPTRKTIPVSINCVYSHHLHSSVPRTVKTRKILRTVKFWHILRRLYGFNLLIPCNNHL